MDIEYGNNIEVIWWKPKTYDFLEGWKWKE